MGSRVKNPCGGQGAKLKKVLSLRSIHTPLLIHYSATDTQFTILYSRVLVSQNNTSGYDRLKHV